ncbi:flavin reductase family protein [Halegenticoccus tardaugens]|uniref:flavin reductase family protein n=1 Tax=Halegenticoccus tardaugens TaxID=2071624 RepID=UPI00100A8F0B|nr:flavin reductase family protein [Halegenticoccus tardaugens]
MEEFDVEELTLRENGRIIKSAVTPRPIAWVSTVSEDGVDNLAPYSSYNYVSSSHPVVLFNAQYRENGELKDSARNALNTGEFVVNVVTEQLARQMDQTSATLPPEESEFDFAEVERAKSRRVSPPRVADAVVSMECNLYDSIEIYDKLMVLGEVEYFHISEDVLTDGKIDMKKLDVVGRLGGPYYTAVDRLELTRNY